MNHMKTGLAALAVAAGLPMTAAAQVALCQGQPEGQWVGEDAASSDVSGAEQAFEVMSIAPVGQTIMSLFQLSAPASVRLEAVGGMGGDTVVELFSVDGTSIGLDDDSGGGTDSRLELDLEAGQYCLQTSSFNEGVLAASVRIGLQSHEPMTDGVSRTTPNDDGDLCDLSDAPQIALVPGADGSFETYEEIIIPENGRTVRLDVSGTASVALEAINDDADPTLSVYDETGDMIHENDDFDGLNSFIDLSDGLAAGTYCVHIDAINDSALPVTFRVSHLDPAVAAVRAYDQGDKAPPLDGSYPVTDLGELPGRLRVDVSIDDKAAWYSFDLNDAALIAVETVGDDNLDTYVEVFDDLGRSLGYNDDRISEEGALDSLLFVELAPGQYTVAITTIGDEAGTLRAALRRYVLLED